MKWILTEERVSRDSRQNSHILIERLTGVGGLWDLLRLVGNFRLYLDMGGGLRCSCANLADTVECEEKDS